MNGVSKLNKWSVHIINGQYECGQLINETVSILFKMVSNIFKWSVFNYLDLAGVGEYEVEDTSQAGLATARLHILHLVFLF